MRTYTRTSSPIVRPMKTTARYVQGSANGLNNLMVKRQFLTSMRCAAVRLRKFGKYPCQELLCPTLPGSGAPLAIYVIYFRIVYLNENVIIWPLAEFVVIFITLNP